MSDGLDWRVSASCLSVTPDIFHPEPQGASTAAAMRVCAGCPVRIECLTEHVGEPFGVWGGTTPKQRRRMRRGGRWAA